ncbi:MAG TPA: phosphotriesterase-related protein [Candidatus Bathyarchaeia archaeon]|nr:phosphotriesterase-related protein [Candidatus Bathyarchaeia archaeon]
MEVQTVTGKIAASEMGVTLPHEHIFIDLNCVRTKPATPEYEWLVDAKVSLDILGMLLHHGTVCKDNLILDNSQVAMKEVLNFKKLGGRTIVDMTNRGLSPKPNELRALSKEVGLNIIAGCGYYVAASHPPELKNRTVDQLAEEMIRDLKEGIDGTDIRSGIIGEVGTSHPIHESERKVLRAAARAQRSTGVSISVHLASRGRHAMQVIDLLESEGVDPSRIILSHMDEIEDPSLDHHKAVAERGAYVEFDCFGEEDYVDEANFVHPRDKERVRNLTRLIDSGYIDSLLISQDVCTKIYTRAYGGYGYDHIQRTIIPMLKQTGVSDAEIEHITIENALRAIAH